MDGRFFETFFSNERDDMSVEKEERTAVTLAQNCGTFKYDVSLVGVE